MSVTAPTYVAVATMVRAIRFVHGVDCFGLTEVVDASSGVPVYTLTVPNDNGDLIAREGDWVIQGAETSVYQVCPDSLFRSVFTQEGVVPS